MKATKTVTASIQDGKGYVSYDDGELHLDIYAEESSVERYDYVLWTGDLSQWADPATGPIPKSRQDDIRRSIEEWATLNGIRCLL